jgi:hypothetical protein
MAIIKRLNPKANPDNMFQLTEIDNMCCDDTTSVEVKDYTATVAVTAGTTKISSIRLAGTNYPFGTDYDPTQKRDRDALKAEIEAAVVKAGYTAEGISVNMVSTNLVVIALESSLVFTGLNASSNAFVASNTRMLGY